jgi:hypothetical protein
MKQVMQWTLVLAIVAGCSGTASFPEALQSASNTAQATGTVSTHAGVAADSLKTFTQLVRPSRTLGFQSPEEIASVTLAEPFPLFVVGLEDLQAYRTGADARSLFTDQHAVFYPLTVSGEVRSGMVVRNDNGVWKTSQFGRPVLATRAHAARARLVADRGVAIADVSLVEIPALSIRLLAHLEGGVMMVTPLYDVRGSDFRAGTAVRADDLFATLQPLAERRGSGIAN